MRAATPGEVTIDGEGGTLVPGLYEMHAHTGQGGTLLNLAAGVTSSVRDMGNDNAVLDALIDRDRGGQGRRPAHRAQRLHRGPQPVQLQQRHPGRQPGTRRWTPCAGMPRAASTRSSSTTA
jgi:predicted amidohydrolase YtcJ